MKFLIPAVLEISVGSKSLGYAIFMLESFRNKSIMLKLNSVKLYHIKFQLNYVFCWFHRNPKKICKDGKLINNFSELIRLETRRDLKFRF